jgi:hypothetical protein
MPGFNLARIFVSNSVENSFDQLSDTYSTLYKIDLDKHLQFLYSNVISNLQVNSSKIFLMLIFFNKRKKQAGGSFGNQKEK